MREIKFRAWDKKNKKWTLPLVACSGRMTLVEPFNHRKDTSGNLIKVEVMQYTGLKDKNGKEIYEGDILGFSPNGIHGVVGFGEHDVIEDYYMYEAYGWYLENKKEKFGILTEDVTDFEIIGNIYENPELLKEK